MLCKKIGIVVFDLYPRTVLTSVLVASALGCDARLKWIALLYIIVKAGAVGKSRG
jgi:hypothetical protein